MSKESDEQFRTANIRPELEDLKRRFTKLFHTLTFGLLHQQCRDWAVCVDCMKVLKPHKDIVDEGCIPIAKRSPPVKDKAAIVLDLIRRVLVRWIYLPHMKLDDIQEAIPILKAQCLHLEQIVKRGLDEYDIQGDLIRYYLVHRSENKPEDTDAPSDLD